MTARNIMLPPLYWLSFEFSRGVSTGERRPESLNQNAVETRGLQTAKHLLF